MAFPTVRSTVATADTVTALSHGVTLPPTVEAGDLLLVLVAYDGNPTVTWPAGWTAVPNVSGPGGNSACRLEARYKVADGTEDSTSITLSINFSEQRTARAFAITGYSGTPEGDSLAQVTNQPNPPSLTPSWGAADTLWFSLFALDNGTRLGGGLQSANYTNKLFDRNGNSGGACIASARRELNVATEDPGNWTIQDNPTEECRSATIAIQGSAPAPAVGRSFAVLVG